MTRLLFLAIALAAPLAPQTQSVSVSGTWTVSSSISGNQSEQTCTFTQKDAELTGSCEGDRGTVSIAGKIDGKNVTWQFDTEYEGQKLTPVYSGTVESPEKIVGTVDIREMGVNGEFTATKAK
jgi:hypothetical protein